ncbi:MAG TPA: heparinase II/III family protein [Planctomycetota bacterium]|nr:heparinase II/III family protein [Planctomycetota bacterium]
MMQPFQNARAELTRAFFFCLLTLLLSAAAAGETPPPVFAPPPRLAISAEELAAQKARPDFASIRDAAIKAAAPLLNNAVVLPDGFGSWVYYYACADDGTTLKAIDLNTHECPRCKKRYSDERTVAAYRGVLHSQAEQAALKLAWAYAYTGEDAYAVQVKRILKKFADDYPNYPGRIDRWGRRGFLAPLGGRRRVQSLEEAEGILPLAKAYDLTRTSPAWSEPEREHVEKNFFRLTAETLLRYPMGIQNRQAWYNAGLMAIASVLADATLVDKALHGTGGFFDQLQRGVADDGCWWEGTMAYQSYVVQPMIQTIDIARRMNILVQENERFKKLLLSPLRAAYPDGSFPCVNDSDPANIHLFDYAFGWAWSTYKDPVFAHALAFGNPAKLTELLGADAKPLNPLDESTRDLSGAGLLFLRAGRGKDAVCVAHHYGIPGGNASGHAHPDKLNITLFANGREWLADIGRIGYTHKEYKSWAKRSIAHNTVILNQTDQLVNTGRIVWLKSGEGFSACCTESTQSYPGTTLRRYLYLTPELLVDVFDVTTAHPGTIDLAAHAVVDSLTPDQPLKSEKLESLGSDNGYQHLSSVLAFKPDAPSTFCFASGDKKLRVHLCPAAGETVFTSIGIGFHPDQKAPCLIRRRVGGDARFISVYDLSRTGDAVQSVEQLAAPTPRVKLRVREKVIEIVFKEAGVELIK